MKNFLPIKPKITVTIDGPAASGKTSLAKALADSLRVPFLSTGHIFRAIAFIHMTKDKILTAKEIKNRISLHTPEKRGGEIKVLVDGLQLSQELRTAAVTEKASQLAQNKTIQKLVGQLTKTVQGQGLVVEGRNAGTTYVPQATLKVYLTAPIAVRALRRFKEQKHSASPQSLAEITQAINKRDKLDKERTADPLRVPSQAFILDNSNLNLAECVELVLAKIAAQLSP